MRTLRSRFILSHILPILVVVPLAGLALIYLLETQVVISEMSDDLTEKANIIADTVGNRPEVLVDPQTAESYLSAMTIYIDAQIFVLQPDGRLIASSNHDQSNETQVVPGQNLIDEVRDGEQSVVVTYGWIEQKAEVLVPVVDVNQELVGILGVTETLEGTASIFGRLRTFIIVAIVIELILGIILAIILAGRMERPISQAAEAVAGIAGGERIETIPVKGPDEIQQLIASVNTLAERLRILEDSRRRLLANLVHELGRPLGAIRSAVHVLRVGGDQDPETRQELLAGVEEEVIRMQPLLDDLAQLHGQVLGTLELDRKPLSLSDWLPSILMPWRASALEKGLQWQTSIATDLPTLDLDADRMGQVIGNLLSNAIKYTPPGKEISVSAGADDDEVWIEVLDTGPGIISDEQEKVFEPFYRSQQERRFPQGLGLGLTIARDLVEAHGGRLEVDSQAGSGSRFTIHLDLQNSAS